jgi:uncharacterized protein YndB with AHSA1/START domain
MAEILHRVGIKASTQDVYRALATRQGLADWWTTDTRGTSSEVGGVIEFHFGTRGFFDMKVLELDPGKRVAWQVVRGPEDWVGSKVSFELKQEGEQVTMLFKHEGWREQSEFMHHCSTKWATFLLSMKALVETGKGRPFPDDLRITVNAD